MLRASTLLLSAVAGAAFLAGCSSTPVAPQTPPVETRQTAAAAEAAKAEAAAKAAAQSRITTIDLAAQQQAAAKQKASQEQAALQAVATRAATAAATAPRVVFFDFDSFVIKEEFKPALDVHAKALATNKARKLTVEGHADERGGREYNLALGQKRAEAVVKSLALLGATEQQIEAVSFGEERPAATAHEEAAWTKNRRAELKDR